MSTIIGDCGCPQCTAAGGDKTQNHLILFEDGGSFCPKCGYKESSGTFTKPSPTFGKDLTREEADAEVKILQEESTVQEIKERGLSKKTCEHFGVRVTLSEADGQTQTSVCFPEYKKIGLSGYKVRYPSKHFGKKGITKECLFFGSNSCPNSGNKLFITEGEYDAMALYQVLWEKSKPEWRDSIAVVSLATGSTTAAKEMARNKELISKFKEIILVFDQDEAGEKAVKDVQKALGREKVKSAKLSLNDPNAMLLAGKKLELWKNSVFADVPPPAGIVRVEDLYDMALVKPEMGLSFPWPTLTKLTFGIRRGAAYVVGAAPKIGKTDFEYELIAHLIKEHGESVALYDLETHPAKTLKRIAGKMMGQVFHKPDVEYDDEALKEGMDTLKSKIEFYDHSGSRDWDDIKGTIRQQAAQGTWLFIIDPLTALISRFSSSEANDKLNEICTDIAEMCTELQITFFLFSHVNPASGGKSHDEGGRVKSSQFTGSRAMEKWTHYGIGIERDRLNEDEEIRNTSTHRLLYDRDFGEGGSYECRYDRDTGVYGEAPQYEDVGGF